MSNSDSAVDRVNGTLKRSSDDGAHWHLVQSITNDTTDFGYSALAELPQFTSGQIDILVVYEGYDGIYGTNVVFTPPASDDNVAA